MKTKIALHLGRRRVDVPTTADPGNKPLACAPSVTCLLGCRVQTPPAHSSAMILELNWVSGAFQAVGCIPRPGKPASAQRECWERGVGAGGSWGWNERDQNRPWLTYTGAHFGLWKQLPPTVVQYSKASPFVASPRVQEKQQIICLTHRSHF